MITEKLIVFLVLVTSIPLAYTRHTPPLFGQQFLHHDVIGGRHRAHPTHNAPGSENQVDTQTHGPDIDIIDINGNAVDTQNVQYQVEDEPKSEIEVVDIEGNSVGSQNNQYEVEDGQNPEIQVVDIDGNVENVDDTVYEMQDPAVQIVPYPKVGANKVVPKSSMLGIQIVEVPDNDVDETTSKIEEDTYVFVPLTPPVVDDSENEVDGPLSSHTYQVCETVECKKLAKEFLKSLNKSVDPCENFYEFACGGWEATNPRPDYTPEWSRFSMVKDLTMRRIKATLESKLKPSDIRPVKQAKKWYRSCMDSESIEQRGFKPFKAITMRAGGWPITLGKEKWSEKEYTWQKVQKYYASLMGSYTFYDIQADYRLEGDTDGQITIDAPKTLLDNELLSMILNDEQRLIWYIQIIDEITKSFGQQNQAPVKNKKLYRETDELLTFEKAIFQLKQEESSEYSISMKELTDLYKSDKTGSKLGKPESRIDWSSEIQSLFNLVNIKVGPSTNVTIKNAAYIEGIGKLLKRTPPRTIVNYIHWNFITKMLPFTTDKMRDIFSDRLLNKVLGATENPPRWLECVQEMKMQHAASYAFVKKYFTQKSTNAAQEMIENIRLALEQKIDNSNWLTPDAKALSKEKLKSMRTFVGFPDWYNNKTAVTNYYDGLTIGTKYFDNNLNYMRFEVTKNLTRFLRTEPEDAPTDEDFPTTVNAFYDPDNNFAEFPAANFQPSFFDTSFPDNVNYGILGLLIGHEMGHGFDSCGITHGKDGGETLLTQNVLRSYYERVDCFVKQFDRYDGNSKVVNETKWDCENDKENKSYGQRTAGENIADSTGLQTVFQAYKKLNQKKNPDGDMRLPGLETFTDDQLFFVSFAELWCEVSTPVYKSAIKALKDEHSDAELRVIGAVSNTKDFAKAFNCPIGSPMNPIDKCNIWDKPGAKMYRSFRSNKNHRWHKHWN